VASADRRGQKRCIARRPRGQRRNKGAQSPRGPRTVTCVRPLGLLSARGSRLPASSLCSSRSSCEHTCRTAKGWQGERGHVRRPRISSSLLLSCERRECSGCVGTVSRRSVRERAVLADFLRSHGPSCCGADGQASAFRILRGARNALHRQR
jgi:hypothetical protein